LGRVIEAGGVVRHLGKKLVLDGLSFNARPGEITAFLGPNGAGKTTTIRVLSTLLRPEEGSVRIAGFDTVKEADEVRRRIGVVTEEAGLLDRLTPREQLTYWGKAQQVPNLDERLRFMVDLLGLHDFMDERAGRLSKGTRQKVAIARALLHDPPVLLLDEPTANLDVVATNSVLELLRRPEIRDGKTVLLATHRLEEAATYSDRIVAIAKGEAVVDGTPDEIAAKAGTSSFAEGFLKLIGQVEMAKESE
jgi:sodium transport system ATP-binding protein